MKIEMPQVINKKSSADVTKVSTIALILLLVVSALVVIVPTTSAYTAVPDRDTATAVGISPTLVGKGQQVIINIMTYPAPAGPTYYAQDVTAGLLGGLNNIWVSIKKPDGTTDTYQPVDVTLEAAGIEIPGQAQIVGSLMFYYYPDQVGNYSVSAEFKGKTYTTDNVYKALNLSVYYKPSSTKSPTTFTVQEEEVLAGILNGYPWSPLPKDYWENPVQTDNREWAAISGDWTNGKLGVQQYITGYNEYSTAPLSSHIIWANVVGISGLPGGYWGSQPYTQAGGFFAPLGNIVLDGKIYQSGKSGYFDCIDLRTGETLWSAPGNPNFAHRLQPFYQTASQQNEGGISVSLWEVPGGFFGTPEWKSYDPFDGDLLQTITNAPLDIQTVAFLDGSPYVFIIQSPGGEGMTGPGSNPGFNNTRPMGIDYCYLIKWDMSKVVGGDWSTGIVWNVSTIDTSLDIYEGEVNVGDNGFFGVRAYPYPEANTVVVKTHNAMQIMEGYDYTTGAFLWRNNNTVLDIGVQDPDGGAAGPIILLDGATQSYVAYDVKNGKEIWRATMGELPWGMVPNYCYCIHNGVFYHGSYDGHVYAVDTATGKQIWQSDYTGDEAESLYGHQPLNGMAVGADGVLYFSSETVYSLMPRTRFHILVAINETTGKFLWKLPIGVSPTAIADGYLTGYDQDNGIQYCIGKGKTATSVTAPLTTVPLGDEVLIQGFVKDMSPGAPDTPAVSDEDMDEWMDYLYGQNATLLNDPPTPTGVPVRLSIADPNGNCYEIGTVTSDSNGLYKTLWTPDVEGEYTIYATFDGSNSYWGSYATTALGVSAAPASTATPEPAQAPIDYTLPIVGSAIAMILAVAIVGLLILRKQK